MTISIKAVQGPTFESVNVWIMTQEGHNMLETTISIQKPKDVEIFPGEDDWHQGRIHFFAEEAEKVLQVWREHNDLVNNVSLGAAKKLKEKGFVWSEMRRNCEIDMEFVDMEWNLTYRKTGMPEKETITIPDGTLHSLFKSINSILFD